MRKQIKQYWAYFLIGIFFIITITYILINQNNIYIQIHDCLDSNIVWIKMLKDNHIFGAKEAVVPFLGGINRNYLYSELKIYMWLYMLFPVFPAMIIGWYLKIIMAIAGFVYLGNSISDDKEKRKTSILLWCGFLYGVAPTYTPVAFAFASFTFLLGIVIR